MSDARMRVKIHHQGTAPADECEVYFSAPVYADPDLIHRLAEPIRFGEDKFGEDEK